MMVRYVLIGIGGHLITVAIGVRLAGACDRGSAQRLSGVHCCTRRQRDGEQGDQQEPGMPQHGAALADRGPSVIRRISRPRPSTLVRPERKITAAIPNRAISRSTAAGSSADARRAARSYEATGAIMIVSKKRPGREGGTPA
jgi:hypothetical protein